VFSFCSCGDWFEFCSSIGGWSAFSFSFVSSTNEKENVDAPPIDEHNSNQSLEEKQANTNEYENANEPPVDEQNSNQSPEEQQENTNENENADEPQSEVGLHFRFHSYLLVVLLASGQDLVHQGTHLMTGWDFVHHVNLVGLNFLVDSDYFVDHLVICSDFVHHLNESLDEQDLGHSPEEQQEDTNENENADQPPIDEQNSNQSPQEQKENTNRFCPSSDGGWFEFPCGSFGD
jgi:FtsZ-interacting cell division protein YlmF